jgi:TetR/AcrR family transcriptional regulator, transcriptional repressor for nem operon
MPLSKEHKQQTRERIVRTAARVFRAEGVHGIGIADLMKQAGLTHGGFYAHFPSKDALVAESCAQGMTESSEQLFAQADAAPPSERLRAIIRGYLSRSHRDTPDTGCVIAALATDVAREPLPVRSAFTQALTQYARRLTRYFPRRPDEATAHPDEPDERALLLLSGMVGALLMARAVDDPNLSDHILLAARRFYMRAYAEDAA